MQSGWPRLAVGKEADAEHALLPHAISVVKSPSCLRLHFSFFNFGLLDHVGEPGQSWWGVVTAH